MGIGDRFGLQGKAQLRAIMKAREKGIPVVPVWNKSNREHNIIGSSPEGTREEADDAVRKLKYEGSYYVDADHIMLTTVDPYIDHSDFFTIDVAEYIGEGAAEKNIRGFIENNKKYLSDFRIPGIEAPFQVDVNLLEHIAGQFLSAIREAGIIYRQISSKKGPDQFITEISMDEVEEPQTPVELFFILSAIAQNRVPIQTIALKFSGRFNKGVDYEGDIELFSREFEEDLLVIDYAVKEFNLPENLKLSVHSGSDKFSIYPVMKEKIRKHDKGIHVKTAGTTWLEELTGLALAGGQALETAKKIYLLALERRKELCAPYSNVIGIDVEMLPTVKEIESWTGEQFASTLRHDPGHPDYNPNFRQLLHVGYKVAAEMGSEFTDMLRKHSEIIGEQVTENLFGRHLCRLFDIRD